MIKANSLFRKYRPIEILLIITILVFTVHYMTDLRWRAITIVYTLLGMTILLFCFFSNEKEIGVITLVIFNWLLSMVGACINGNGAILESAEYITAQACGMALFYNKKSLRETRNILLIMFLYIIYRVITALDVEYMTISKLTGKNTISILTLLMIGVDLLYRRYLQKKIPWYLYLLCSILLIYIKGRGGILSISIYIFILFLDVSKDPNKSEMKLYRVILLILLIFVLRGTVIEATKKLSQDMGRIGIWNAYFQYTTSSIENVIFGTTLPQNSFLYLYGNMHNDFLNAHCFFGIVPMGIKIYIYGYLLYKTLMKKDYKAFAIVISMFVRSLTDATGAIFDFVLFYLFCEVRSIKKTNRYRFGLFQMKE